MILPACQFFGVVLPRFIRRDLRKKGKLAFSAATTAITTKIATRMAVVMATVMLAIVICLMPDAAAWAGTKSVKETKSAAEVKKQETKQETKKSTQTAKTESAKTSNSKNEESKKLSVSDMLKLLAGSRGTIIESQVLPPEPVTVTAERKKQAEAKNAVPKAKQREAQIQSIVALFSKYNKSLKGTKGRQYAEYILQAGEKFNQDPFVIAAMIVHESSVRNDAVSKGGDYGLMQVRWKVHQADIKKKYPSVKQAKDMFDPKMNVMIGTEIFATYRGNTDIRSGLLKYSSGNKKLANKIFASMKVLQDSYQKNLKTLS